MRTLQIFAAAGVLLAIGLGFQNSDAQQNADDDIDKLIRQTMERWRDVADSRPKWLSHERNLRSMYRDVWSTIDIEEAIRQDDVAESTTIAMLAKLAADDRWDTVVRFSKRFQRDNYHLNRFWTRVAQHAVATGKIELVELAGEQVEANAVYRKTAVGGPPRPSRELIGARYLVAAARLELLRGKSKGQDLLQAADDLYRAAGAYVPRRRSLMGITDISTPLLQYAALEAWTPHQLGLQDVYQPFQDQANFKPLHDLISDVHVSWLVRLPELDDTAVVPWIYRQLHQARHDVALCYVARATGNSMDRARLLAVIAADMYKSESNKARICRELAAKIIDSSDDADPWLRLEAMAELAIAQHNVDENLAKRTAAEAIKLVRDIHFEETNKKLTNYESLKALCCAMAVTGAKREDLPVSLHESVDRLGYHRVPKSETPVRVRGIDRTMDLSRIAKPASAPKPTPYQKLVDAKDWPAAVARVQENAKGNPAWNSNHPELGKRSFLDLGLAETLKWTADIKDTAVRMKVEIGAIREAVKYKRRSLPNYRQRNTPGAVAPGLNPFPADC